MDKPYELQVPEGYRLHLERRTLVELYATLAQRGFPPLFYTAREGTVAGGEEALGQELVIFGNGFEVHALPIIRPDGSKIIRGKIAVPDGSTIDTKSIEAIVKEFSIRPLLQISTAQVGAGDLSGIF